MKKTFLMTTTIVLASFITAVFLCVRTLRTASPVSAFSSAKMRVVLDAGHGGIDGGVVGVSTGTKESDLNLSIVFILKETLEDMGFEVALTRKTEGGLYGSLEKGFKKRDMQKRQEIIEEVKPDFVLSIHQNYYPSKSSRGGQVFYNKQEKSSEMLANNIQTQLNELYAEKKVKGRNASSGEYFMLECTAYPSVIIECGFLSSPLDDELLNTKEWQTKISHAITAGVMTYFSAMTS